MHRLLPPAYEVPGDVMFSLCLLVHREGTGRGYPARTMTGNRHLFLSTISLGRTRTRYPTHYPPPPPGRGQGTTHPIPVPSPPARIRTGYPNPNTTPKPGQGEGTTRLPLPHPPRQDHDRVSQSKPTLFLWTRTGQGTSPPSRTYHEQDTAQPVCLLPFHAGEIYQWVYAKIEQKMV